MQTIRRESIKNLQVGETLLFPLDNQACVGRAKMIVNYVKVNQQMADGVVGYKTSFDKETNKFSVEALGE